jgi:steroid 5-alpha reductase family enzyme
LACSSVGFKRPVYFVSFGYALSIGAQAIVFGAINATPVSGRPMVQGAVLLMYSIRLGVFLRLRSSRGGFQRELKQELAFGAQWSLRTKVAIWWAVSLLYLSLFLPTLLNLAAQTKGQASWSAPTGVAVMIIGLVLEGTADWQKSHFKLSHPNRFCDVQLYRIVRYPNYLGEIVFWLGSWFASVSAYRTSLQWIFCTLGSGCMVGVMLDATRRLELKQAARYGSENLYRIYAATVPVLFPLLPVYSLRAPGNLRQ